MQDQNASGTAFGTLYIRAVHQLVDEKPLILEDPVAVSLLGEETATQIKKNRKHQQTPEARALRTHVVLRSRFSEDHLAEAVKRGVRQYVLLGAGFDTFAYRQPPWAAGLKIFEVDHPATQAQKKIMLNNAGVAVPPNLSFANINFEQESLRDGLIRNGVSFTEPAFFSWLGVMVYLREEVIDDALKTIAAFPTKSEVAFTFSQPPELLSEKEKKFNSSLSKIVGSSGEPFLSFFTPDTIENKLRGMGFKDVGFLSGEEAKRRYFPKDPHNYIYRRSVIAYAAL